MAGPAALVSEALDNVAGFLHSQIHDKEKWENNYKIGKALGIFAGSIFLMRTCGDLMAI